MTLISLLQILFQRDTKHSTDATKYLAAHGYELCPNVFLMVASLIVAFQKTIKLVNLQHTGPWRFTHKHTHKNTQKHNVPNRKSWHNI